MFSKIPKLVGFNVDFEHPLNPQYKCPICNFALRVPHQTKCGHRYCEACIKEAIRETKQCPIDKSPLSLNDIFKDAFCNREILDLLCYCQYKKVGCDWKDRLALLEKHTNEDCQFVEIKCPNDGCKVMFERRYLERHVNQACRFKKQKCSHCGETISAELLKDHYEKCPKIKEPCVNGCGQEIPRDAMTKHLSDQCTMIERMCPYAIASCDFKGFRGDLEKHLQTSSVEHSSMLAELLSGVKSDTDLVKDKISPLVQHIDRLEQQVIAQNDELANIRDNIAVFRPLVDKHEVKIQELVGKLKSEGKEILEVGASGVNVLKDQVQKLEEQLQKVQIQSIGRGKKQQGPSVSDPMAIGKQIQRMEDQIALTDVQMAEHDVKISVLEATSYDGRYIWKIDDLGRRINEAINGKTVSIYSPPFYVKRFGYKACARVYLNGDGMGKDSHISLFFVIMRGNYDSLLPWPFRQKVTFRLLDQGGDQHISDSFLPDPKSSSFQRPTGNMNVASGCPLFVPKPLLTTRGYSKDNCLFFVINVDTDGLPLLYF